MECRVHPSGHLGSSTGVGINVDGAEDVGAIVEGLEVDGLNVGATVGLSLGATVEDSTEFNWKVAMDKNQSPPVFVTTRRNVE